MKYYQELAAYSVFTLKQAMEVMGSKENAPQYLNHMIKRGYVRRIKKNLYTCIDLVTGDDVGNRYHIGTAITRCSAIAYHSAFEFYGLYNQVFYEVQVASMKRFLPFDDEGYSYKCYMTSLDKQIDAVAGVKVTSIERTIIDSINMLGKVMDVEELIKCLELIHIVNEDKLIEVLVAYDKDILYRKVGYVLSYFKNEFCLTEEFFLLCKGKSNCANGGRISSNEIRELIYIPEWGIYGYKNPRNLANKGADILV